MVLEYPSRIGFTKVAQIKISRFNSTETETEEGKKPVLGN